MTILEVDDCKAQNYALTRMLENAGCKVLRAFTGTEALALASQMPDAVLLDINLPDINGFEVCRRLKSDPTTSDIPVVFLTAMYDASAKAMARSIGAKTLLHYPVEEAQLHAVLEGQILRATFPNNATQDFMPRGGND